MPIKKICCIGAGYVGGPTMAVIALKCPEIEVCLVDVNEERIALWNDEDLSNLPICEPGLKEIVEKTRGKNLFFSTDIKTHVDQSDLIFIAVNTPTKTQGEGKGKAVDLTFIEKCAHQIVEYSTSDKIIIEKSTLPVRTAEKLKAIFHKHNKTSIHFEVLSNPEFLAEGTAIQDLYKSDRVLIGGDSSESGKDAVAKLRSIYERWIPKEKILETNIWSSELSKLASNAMLAQRISSINSLSVICEKTGAEISEVAKAIGMDKRIGDKFLMASAGFGGSCFQKDILNLVYLCEYYGLSEVASYWMGVIQINDYQRIRFADKILELLDGDISNKKIVLLGWAFKNNTNDSRESASIYIADKLIGFGAEVHIFDPKVKHERIKMDLMNLWQSRGELDFQIFSKLNQIRIHNNTDTIFENAEGIALLTNWAIFKSYDWKEIENKAKKTCILFDGKNVLSKNTLESLQCTYYKIGND